MELLNDQGLRVDGRRPEELRMVRCRLGVASHADGSAYLEMGNTKVLAAVFGPNEVRPNHRSKAHSEAAFINCQLNFAPFSRGEARRVARPRDKKTIQSTITLHQALKSVIRSELLPKSQVDIMVEVLNADGGNYCAALNASTLALIDAGVPLREYVIGCTASLANNSTPMVDISHLEETLGGPSLTIAMLPNSKKITFMEMTERFHVDYLEDVMKMAQKGCLDIYEILNQTVRQYLSEIGKSENFRSS